MVNKIIYLSVVNENVIKMKNWLQLNIKAYKPISEIIVKWKETCEICREYLFSLNININHNFEEYPMFKRQAVIWR